MRACFCLRIRQAIQDFGDEGYGEGHPHIRQRIEKIIRLE